MKYTPGPWEVSRGAQQHAFSVEAGAGTVALIPYMVTTAGLKEEANARLIAAAPDLLEALKAIVELGNETDEAIRAVEPDYIPFMGGIRKVAEEAITKATE